MKYLTPEQLKEKEKFWSETEKVNGVWLLEKTISDCLDSGSLSFTIASCFNKLFNYKNNNDITKSIREQLKESGWQLKRKYFITIVTLGALSTYKIVPL